MASSDWWRGSPCFCGFAATFSLPPKKAPHFQKLGQSAPAVALARLEFIACQALSTWPLCSRRLIVGQCGLRSEIYGAHSMRRGLCGRQLRLGYEDADGLCSLEQTSSLPRKSYVLSCVFKMSLQGGNLAKLDFIFSVHMCAISESISVMRMLAEQAEKNVALALKEADEQGAVKEHEHEEEAYDQYGESYMRQRTFYSCGSSVGYDYDEVLMTYKFMITQLTRRSALLTMFGLFEHRMSQCLGFMLELTGFEGKLKGMGPIEKAHSMLKKIIGGEGIADLDHLTVIRNVMAHSDGTAKGYRVTSTRKGSKSFSEKRMLSALRKTKGVSVNIFDGVLMDEIFLEYAVCEFQRYVNQMEAAVQRYQAKHRSDSSKSRRKGWLRKMVEHWVVKIFA